MKAMIMFDEMKENDLKDGNCWYRCKWRDDSWKIGGDERDIFMY